MNNQIYYLVYVHYDDTGDKLDCGFLNREKAEDYCFVKNFGMFVGKGWYNYKAASGKIFNGLLHQYNKPIRLSYGIDYKTAALIKKIGDEVWNRKPPRFFSDEEIMDVFRRNGREYISFEWKKVAFQTYAVKYCAPVVDLTLCPVGDCVFLLI